MIHRTHILIFLLSVPLLISSSIFAQEDDSSVQKTKWELQKSYEELKAIIEKPHDPELEVDELKIFLKPGMYDVTVTTTLIESNKSDQPKKSKRTELTRIKYVDGKYIVSRTEGQEGVRWSVTAFDESCSCYRGWAIFGDQIYSLGIGNQIENTRIIAWSRKYLNTDKQQIGNAYQIISKERTSRSGKYTTVFDDRTYINIVEFSFKNPLSETHKDGEKDQDDGGKRKETY